MSKNGGVWLAFRLEDVDGGVECRAWPATYEQYRDLLVRGRHHQGAGAAWSARAKARRQLIAIEVQPFSGVSEYRPLTVTIDAGRVRASVLDDLAASSPTSPARCRWCCTWCAISERARLRVGDGLRVAPVAGLYAELKALLGESCIGVG